MSQVNMKVIASSTTLLHVVVKTNNYLTDVNNDEEGESL